MRTKIRELIEDIVPHDELEAAHMSDTLTWIDSGEPLFRVAKPDTPPKHLVSYFVLFDEVEESVLLIHHNKAQLWLPTGGHVEIDEYPNLTVSREAMEELSIRAEFYGPEKPLFITATSTNDSVRPHVDVSLWYVLKGKVGDTLSYDGSEFSDHKWLTFDEILDTDIAELDPQMHRFVHKLINATII